MIPKIIHQIWRQGEADLKERHCYIGYNAWNYQGLIDSWRKHYPDFKHLFWAESLINAFLTTESREIRFAYSKLSYIEQIDFFRYLIIYQFGGIYADCDTLPLKSVEPLLNTDFLAGIEENRMKHWLTFPASLGVTQYFFAAAPRHPLIKAAIDFIVNNAEMHTPTLEKTGPGLLSYLVLNQFKLPVRPVEDFGVFFTGNGTEVVWKNPYLLHANAGTWKDESWPEYDKKIHRGEYIK